MSYWKVAVDAPLYEPLIYSDESLDESSRSLLDRGVWVEIQLGHRSTHGMVLGKTKLAEPITFSVKSILGLITELPPLDDEILTWMEWLSEYYIYPVGEIMASVAPPLQKATGKSKNKTKKSPVVKSVEYREPPKLTTEQSIVVSDVLATNGFSAHLIFGVTGSGKTEIYMQILTKILEKDLFGLVIVPEISLTPQLLDRFTSRFGERVATIHSHLTPREKTNQWWDIVDEKKQILIGARSALFCPIPRLGVIIVDEEHEPSFKQEDYLKYHARDAAIKLAQIKNIPVLLGSATPSLESWKNATEGRYRLHRLSRRVEDRSMPVVDIVDLKAQKQLRKDKPSTLPNWLSEDLYGAIEKRLERREQSAIFLNRRGFANVVQCLGCGFVMECPNCDISLTLHGQTHLVCHYCAYEDRLTEICSNCNQSELSILGLGTEQVEQDLKLLFPENKISRADRDEITSREDIEDLILRMENNEIDILVGTQMIAKGLDFPHLTLVGLVNADVGLHLPDFRAAERGFQIITQVSGRAGRHIKVGEEPGRVIIQTYNPRHPSIINAIRADYESFAMEELKNREELLYPPYGKMAVIRIVGTDLSRVLEVAHQTMGRGRELQKRYGAYSDLFLMGPSEFPMARLRNQHRYQVLVKGVRTAVVNAFVKQVLRDRKWVLPQVKVQVDIDPFNML